MNSNIKLNFVTSDEGFLSEFVEGSVERPADRSNGECIIHYSGEHSKCKMRVKLVNGKREGVATILDDGAPFIRLTYRNGVLTGNVERMNQWGMVGMRGHLVNGVESGLFEEYDRNEKVVWRGYYRKGKRYSEVVENSKVKGYYDEESVESGVLLTTAQYDTSLHDKNGRCLEYENGEWIGEWMYENGVKKRTIREYRNGTLTLYDELGNKTYEGQFSKEELKDGFYEHEPMEGMDGFFKELDSNGRLVRITECDEMKMKKNGRCFEVEDGKVKRVCLYESDEMKRVVQEFDGSTMIEYDPSGQIVYEGGFKGDMKSEFIREGEGKEYVSPEPTGSGLSTERKEPYTLLGTWTNGKKTGKFYELDENGARKRMCLFVDDEISQVVQVFKDTIMILFNSSGKRVYEGEYKGSIVSGFVSNGNGKEYGGDGETAIYSGEWKDGKREGLGTEYSQGYAVYTGEWKNGKRNGSGKEMDENGNVVFVGEWKDGKGKGKEMDGNGNVIYEGEWSDGKRNGKGEEKMEKGMIRLGHWRDGKIKNGQFYELNGNRVVKRMCVYENDELKLVAQEFNGSTMIERNKEGKVYEGGFKGDVENGFIRNGNGMEYESSQIHFLLFGEDGDNSRLARSGFWKNGKKSGRFYEYDDYGSVKQVCLYENDEMDRVIKEFDGDIMVEYNKKGNRIYKGHFAGDTEAGFVRQGKGKEYKDGSRLPVYSGKWKNGKRGGMGTEYSCLMPLYLGRWKNNERSSCCNWVIWIPVLVVAAVVTLLIVFFTVF